MPAFFKPCQNLVRAVGFVVLMAADHGRADIKMIQQSQCMPGILGGNQIGSAQHFKRSGRDIFQIADRSGANG